MTDQIRNCVVFISDALRWDHLPDRLLEDDLAVRTVAASIDTSTSTPSMLTGLTPPRHGVYSFGHQIPPGIDSIFDLEGFDTGFYNAAGPEDGLNEVLRQDELRSLDDLEPPFVYVERDHGGHHPYYGTGYEDSLQSFKREFAGDIEKVRETYAEAIEASVERFEERVAAIEERGLLEETLFVFTSDHGELLGEDGWVGHLSPIYPELVYVPTVFRHPSLPDDVDREFMGHIDLLPTILSLLGVEGGESEGVDVLGDEPIDNRYNYAAKSFYVGDRPFFYYEGSGLWDADGGHVFNHSSIPWRLLSVAYLLSGRKWMSRHLRRTPTEIPAAASGYLRSHRTFGTPGFSADEARDYVREAEQNRVDNVEIDLDDNVEERLKQLGYR